VGGRCWAPGLDTSVIRRMFHASVAGGIADAEVFAQQPFDCRGAARVAGLHAVDRISRGAALRGARCARRVDALETGLTTSWIGGAADVVLHEQIDRLVVTVLAVRPARPQPSLVIRSRPYDAPAAASFAAPEALVE